VEEVLEVVDRFQMKDLMGFKYDWNAEIIAQFHATFYYNSYTDFINWMTEGVHYKINIVTFARLLGFGKTDRERDTINFENHLKNHQIADAYFLDEMAQGTTLGLKPVYYVLNNLLRQTIYPKGGSESTSLRSFAPNLIARMLPGAAPFSVSKFIWYDLITSMENGVDNFPYAPYVMYIIELVIGYIFKKECEHYSYQVKQWQHQKTEAAVQACIDSANKSAKNPATHDDEASHSRPKKKESTFKKIKELIRHSLSMCTYSATQAYEAMKDINRLLSHNGLATQTIPPPPIFFDDFSSSEEEAPQHISSEDEEPLSAKLQKMKAKTKPTPRGIRRVSRELLAVASVPHLMKMKTLAPRTPVRSGLSDDAQRSYSSLLFFSFLLTC
jgi:hypothetical protein